MTSCKYLMVSGTALLLMVASASSAQATPVVVQIAQAELHRGVQEVPMGSNRGTRIKMYEQAVPPSERAYPAQWCGYFVSWVTRQAGQPIGPNGVGFASVDRLRAWAVRTGRWTHRAAAGELIIFADHVGIVRMVHGHSLTGIEGNWSDRVSLVAHRDTDADGYVVPPRPVGLHAQVIGHQSGGLFTAGIDAGLRRR